MPIAGGHFYGGEAGQANLDGDIRHRRYDATIPSSETDKSCINFDFIYEKTVSYYSNVGRKPIDLVIMIKMFMIGYLYEIKSERCLEEEVSLNLVSCWFCDIELMQRVLDYSSFR